MYTNGEKNFPDCVGHKKYDINLYVKGQNGKIELRRLLLSINK